MATFEIDDAYYLGDPRYYTKIVQRNIPWTKEWKQIYKSHFDLNLDSSKEVKTFKQSSELLDFLCEFDFCLFVERTLNHIVKDFHVEWAHIIEGNPRSIIMAPRDHGKSQFIRDYVLWNAFYKKRKNILIISETQLQAKTILGGEDSIKEQIESNDIIHHLKPSGLEGKWSETLIVLANGVRIEIAGWDQRLRGRHPDLILLDDVLSDQNSGTKELRKKVFHYYTHVVYPMMKKFSKIFIVGTSHHPNDLLFRLGKTGEYKFKLYQSINEDTKEALWPERHDYKSLEIVRRMHGEMAFQREYQNNPMSDSLRFFPEDVLDHCKDFDLSYLPYYHENNLTHFGGDLSPPGGAKKGEGDYTVFIDGMVDKNGVISLIHYTKFRDSPDSTELFFERQLKTVTDICYNFDIDHGFIEEVGFQAIYTKEFLKKRSSLPIDGFNVTAQGKRSERAGIPYMRGLMEKRLIRFPYKTVDDRRKTDEFLRDFEGVIQDEDRKIQNTSSYDDCVIATWMMVESVKTITKPMFFLPSPLKRVMPKMFRHRFKFARGRK